MGNKYIFKSPDGVLITSPPATEQTGAMGREIESGTIDKTSFI
jgi:hypothetical protein